MFKLPPRLLPLHPPPLSPEIAGGGGQPCPVATVASSPPNTATRSAPHGGEGKRVNENTSRAPFLALIRGHFRASVWEAGDLPHWFPPPRRLRGRPGPLFTEGRRRRRKKKNHPSSLTDKSGLCESRWDTVRITPALQRPFSGGASPPTPTHRNRFPTSSGRDSTTTAMAAAAETQSDRPANRTSRRRRRPRVSLFLSSLARLRVAHTEKGPAAASRSGG